MGDPDKFSPNVASIVDRVTPAVLPIYKHQQFTSKEDLIHQTMRANVEQSVHGLQMRSRILRSMVDKGQIRIIGAEYSIETGVVDFYLDE